MAAAAAPSVKADGGSDTAKAAADRVNPRRPIPDSRLVPASYVHGEALHITLPDDETLEEGEQDLELFARIGVRMSHGQFLEIENDAGSMWRLMRVARIYGTPGTGLRGLVLRDVVPPCFNDLDVEPVIKTGDWYVRHGGPHKRWQVITPGGVVFRERINTESEARTVKSAAERNPKPR